MYGGTEVVKSYFRNISLVAVRNARFMMELFEGLRRRKGGVGAVKDAKKEEEITRDEKNLKEATATGGTVEPGTYWLTRIVFLRSLGFIYCKLLKNFVWKFFLEFFLEGILQGQYTNGHLHFL